MRRDWKLPLAAALAATLISISVSARPMSGLYQVPLGDREFLRIDADTGKSQACTTESGGERCLTLSEEDGRFMPRIRDEMREIGVRDTVRARLRGEASPRH